MEKVASNVVEHKVDDAFDRVGDVLGEPVEKVARSTGEKIVEVSEDVAAKVSGAAEDRKRS